MENAEPKVWMCIICGWMYDEAKGAPEEGLAEMHVGLDESRHHHGAAGVDHPGRGVADITERGDAPFRDAQVSFEDTLVRVHGQERAAAQEDIQRHASRFFGPK